MGWVVLIVGLLSLGFLIDRIAEKRNIQLDPKEGAKNASDAERIYVETYLHNQRETNSHPFL
jgi:predicted DNA-binding ribbon-helix-helix protein